MQIFFKVFLVSLCISLVVFAFGDNMGLMTLVKMLAVGTAASIAIAGLYPQLRGVKEGDTVSAVQANLPALMGRFGKALTCGKMNNQIKVRFENGDEAVAIIEKYGGVLSPPKVRIVYEEKLIE